MVIQVLCANKISSHHFWSQKVLTSSPSNKCVDCREEMAVRPKWRGPQSRTSRQLLTTRASGPTTAGRLAHRHQRSHQGSSEVVIKFRQIGDADFDRHLHGSLRDCQVIKIRWKSARDIHRVEGQWTLLPFMFFWPSESCDIRLTQYQSGRS